MKWSLLRLILSYNWNKIIKYFLNIKSNEFTTSYRGFNLNKLTKFNLDMINSKGYSFFMETIVHLINLVIIFMKYQYNLKIELKVNQKSLN